MSLIGRFLGPVITKGRLEIIHADGAVDRLGSATVGFPDVRIRFTDRHVIRRIVANPRLGAAEAFMDGRLVIEQGDIMDLIELVRSNRPWERGGRLKEPGPIRRVAEFFADRRNRHNRQTQARANVAHHYDIGNALYRLFLDQDMQYSCAYFAHPGMSLEEAQLAKKVHIAAKLDLKPGQRVLDIGCGWGGMALHLHRTTGVDVVGITLSAEQLDLARQRAQEEGVGDHVTFELIDYRDLARQRPGEFDRIVSVGMFEHVGQAQFDLFFRCCANLMRDDGVMLLHTIGRFGMPGQTDAFTRKYIFPGGYIPALSETIAASEKSRLIATDIETLRLHYALTLREWYKRTLAQREQIVALYDERFYRMWTFYLAGATAAFESGGMGNYQIQFSRNRHTLPLTRDYIARREAELSDRG